MYYFGHQHVTIYITTQQNTKIIQITLKLKTYVTSEVKNFHFGAMSNCQNY